MRPRAQGHGIVENFMFRTQMIIGEVTRKQIALSIDNARPTGLDTADYVSINSLSLAHFFINSLLTSANEIAHEEYGRPLFI